MKICSNLEFKRLYGTRFALKVICSARFVSTFARTKDCLLLRLSCHQRSPVFCNMTNFSFLTDLMQSGPIAAVLLGTGLSFAATALGAAVVFVPMSQQRARKFQPLAMGFAAGIMIAASIWSLLIPAMEHAQENGANQWLPTTGGFILGVAFVALLDKITPHMHPDSDTPEGPHVKLDRTTLLVSAVTLHNIPEGMSLGLAFSIAALSQDPAALSSAFALALGMSIQNIPEGAAVSLPLACGTMSRAKAFAVGVFSGAMEPLFGVLTVLALSLVVPYLPWLLAFAAGAMMYVVVEELIPAAHLNEHSDLGTLSVMAGFVVMMLLDTTLG